MKYAYDDKDADGNMIQHYDTKLLDCKLYGRATLYERDLELGNVFEATTQGVGGKQYKYSATDYGGFDTVPRGIKKTYVDANPSVILNLKGAGGKGTCKDPLTPTYGPWSTVDYNATIPFTTIRPDGTTGTSYIPYQIGEAGIPQTIQANLTNYAVNAETGNMMSALIAGELEVTIPSWLNDGRVDQPTQGMSDSSVYQVQKGRREGFVSTELHIDHSD